MINVALLSDSYKYSHHKQTPEGTDYIYSYFESREGATFPGTVWFGLQMILKDYFMTPISKEDVKVLKTIIDAHMGPGIFNEEGWNRIVEVHGGFLPIKINAIPEGIRVPTGNVLMTVENTDPELPWVTNFAETLLTHVWYPSSVATLSYETMQLLKRAALITGCPLELLLYKLHDFGFRGASSFQSAERGGLAHLLNFRGTDTTPALIAAMKYYNTPLENMPGFSIPASEHSTITPYGEENEIDAHENMLDQFPTGPVASVIDSYDTFKMIKWLHNELGDKIQDREGVFILRPDSGEIVSTVMKVLEAAEIFGTYTNIKNYKVLNNCVRVIQGDGCNYNSIGEVLQRMVNEGWCVENIAFGMGAGLLQKVDRDMQRFAFKCSFMTVNGEPRDVQKRPVTDSGKRSKAGKVVSEYTSEEHTAIRTVLEHEVQFPLMRTVYDTGQLLVDESFEEIRNRVR